MIYLDSVIVNPITFSDLQVSRGQRLAISQQMIQAIKKVAADSIIIVFSPPVTSITFKKIIFLYVLPICEIFYE